MSKNEEEKMKNPLEAFPFRNFENPLYFRLKKDGQRARCFGPRIDLMFFLAVL